MAPSGSCATAEIASLLLNSRERIADVAAEAGGSLRRTGRWLVGRTAGARSLRIRPRSCCSCGARSIRLATIWRCAATTCSDLQRAAALDSFDSLANAPGAQGDGRMDNRNRRKSSWRRAMQTNPADPAPRQALLNFLLDQKRFDEAFDLTEASLKYTPKDANLLVDRGFLALRRGHADEALTNWNGRSSSIRIRCSPICILRMNWIAKARRKLRPPTTRAFWKRSRGGERRIVLPRDFSSASCCAWRTARRVPRRPNWRRQVLSTWRRSLRRRQIRAKLESMLT